MPAGVQIGALGYSARARVDACGAVYADGLSLDWWVGADDRWHVPAQESTTRQLRPFPAPVVETTVRIPSGDAVQRVYAVSADGRAVTVVEIENRSPAPFTAALVVSVAHKAEIALDGTSLRLDGEVVLVLPRPPGAWAVGASTREIVMGGGARTDGFATTRGPIEVALLFPVSHRTTWRGALTDAPVDLRRPTRCRLGSARLGRAARSRLASRAPAPDRRAGRRGARRSAACPGNARGGRRARRLGIRRRSRRRLGAARLERSAAST